MPPLTDLDLYLLDEGTHGRPYEKLGAHLSEHDGAPGAHFAVWAPNARSVSLIGDFNAWDAGAHPMRLLGGSGVWEGVVPGVGQGAIYKFAVVSQLGQRVDKADPYAFASELRPHTASIVWDVDRYAWNDASWMTRRGAANDCSAPVAVYEVHLGSWMRVPEGGNRWLTYREAATRLADYAAEMGFTHVELMPIAEHPFDGSWGYQSTSYFAPTSRFGTPDDFKFLIDTLHQRGLAVILDWVPAHFPGDEHGLALFDGTPLYEHPDPRRGRQTEWNTCVFNFGRPGVANFLVGNALFWLDKYHIDGLRVDAVASMLYLDFARKPGEWLPNVHGGRENLEAITLLRRVNERVHVEFPGVATFAEESTAWPNVTRPAAGGGLGFDYKWDLGWMHDTLSYLRLEPSARKDHHNLLTFRPLYAYSENFLLPLSHDEVVYGKGSLLSDMPGDAWRKFANLRLLFGYMYALPGKKLMFMGNELAPWREWNHDISLDWHLLEEPPHKAVRRWVRDLNTTYRALPAMHQLDCDHEGFAWVDCNDVGQSVVSFLRRGRSANELVLVVCNFTPEPRHNYRVGVPIGDHWEEILNSDATLYGGSGQGNIGAVRTSPVAWHGHAQSLNLTLPPLAMLAFSRTG
jgi:1,4-alpha-glucan branching enzyme